MFNNMRSSQPRFCITFCCKKLGSLGVYYSTIIFSLHRLIQHSWDRYNKRKRLLHHRSDSAYLFQQILALTNFTHGLVGTFLFE